MTLFKLNPLLQNSTSFSTFHFSGQSTCGYSVCADIFAFFSDTRLRIQTPKYQDIWDKINQGDSHPLKHGGTSKNPYASIFCSKYSGISDQVKLIEQVTQDQRDGKHPLSKYIVHSITMGSAEDDFSFRFVFQDKEEGAPKVMGSFTSQTGEIYNQKQADIWFGIGFFGTATPSGDRYDKTDDIIHGTYKEICTRDHFIFEASKRKNSPVMS